MIGGSDGGLWKRTPIVAGPRLLWDAAAPPRRRLANQPIIAQSSQCWLSWLLGRAKWPWAVSSEGAFDRFTEGSNWADSALTDPPYDAARIDATALTRACRPAIHAPSASSNAPSITAAAAPSKAESKLPVRATTSPAGSGPMICPTP